MCLLGHHVIGCGFDLIWIYLLFVNILPFTIKPNLQCDVATQASGFTWNFFKIGITASVFVLVDFLYILSESFGNQNMSVTYSVQTFFF